MSQTLLSIKKDGNIFEDSEVIDDENEEAIEKFTRYRRSTSAQFEGINYRKPGDSESTEHD